MLGFPNDERPAGQRGARRTGSFAAERGLFVPAIPATLIAFKPWLQCCIQLRTQGAFDDSPPDAGMAADDDTTWQGDVRAGVRQVRDLDLL
ncbi:MAG: hypothetical protein E5X60_31990, partial [Mesorhizobium sp.]